MACCLLFIKLSGKKRLGLLASHDEKRGWCRMNQMAAMVREEYIPAEKKKPFPREEERAAGFSLGEHELGPLDIVLLDAIFKQDAVCKR